MKYLITIFCLTLLNTDCASTKAGLSKIKPKAENNVFIYKKYSRGFYNEFHIGEEKITDNVVDFKLNVYKKFNC